MDKIKMIDLHRHFFETSELHLANLSPENFLKLHFAISNIYDIDLYTMCGNHDSTRFAKKVWDIYKSIPEEKRKNLHLYPQSEFNVSVNEILTYPDSKYGDDKYVFKKAHVLVAAKKGKEEEFFEKTRVFSSWSDMYIARYTNKELTYEGDLFDFDSDGKIKSKVSTGRSYLGMFNMGTLLKTARNILCAKYCKNVEDRIPFDIYENTTQVGLTYSQIRQIFINDSYNYLVSKNLIPDTPEAKAQMIKDITQVSYGVGSSRQILPILPEFTFEKQKRFSSQYDKKYYPDSPEKSLSRLELRDFNLLFGDTAYYCVAHPETIKIRKGTGLPVSAFDGVDISHMPEHVRTEINKYLEIYKKFGKDHIFEPDDKSGVLFSSTSGKNVFISKDYENLAIIQIVAKNLDKTTKKYGFEIQGMEISPFMFSKTLKHSKQYNWKQFDTLVKLGKVVNCNSAIGDEHFNSERHTSLIDDIISRKDHVFNHTDELEYVCDECGWQHLLENGKVDIENQNLSVRILKHAQILKLEK